MRLTLLVLLLSTSCARRAPAWSDAALVDEIGTVEERPPLEILQGAAASDDPSPRARSLTLLIETTGPDEALAHAAAALSDPDRWVQRAGVLGLAERLDVPGAIAALEALVSLADAPASNRGLAGEVIAGRSSTAKEVLAAAWRAAGEPWDVAPLALAAAKHGDEGALAGLAGALASGELELDVSFLDRVGRSGLEVTDALATGQDLAEEELVLAYASARLQLGDGAGEQEFRRTLSDDRTLRRLEAIDYLLDLDHASSQPLLRKARSGGPELVTWYADLALVIRGVGAPSVLEEAFAHTAREVRLEAVGVSERLLARPSTDRKVARSARRVIEAATRDPAAEVRAAAYDAAGRHADLEAPLSDGVQDEALAVRIEAAGALLRRDS